MRCAVLALMVIVSLAMLGVGGCGSGGGGAGGAAGAGTGSCQAIRTCTLDCGDDTCVTTKCKPRGTGEAQAAFQALYDCTRAAGCAMPGDVNCLCLAQCVQDPPCGAELDACVGATSDPICEVTCH